MLKFVRGCHLDHRPTCQSAHTHVEHWISILQDCRGTRNPENATRFLVCLREQQLEFHPSLVNYLIPTLVQCGCLHDAHIIFNGAQQFDLNLHSWNSLISGYVVCGEPETALCLYHQMEHAILCVASQPSKLPVYPSAITYISLVTACTHLKDVESGHKLHNNIIQLGLEKELFTGSAMVGNSLVDMYTKCGLLAEAHLVFDALPARDVVSWNSLIAGYAEHGFHNEVRIYLQQMLMEDISPGSITFVCSLKGCRDLVTCRQMHAEATKRGLDSQLQLGNSLIDTYLKCGALEEACQVLSVLDARDTVSWNTLIAGYTERGLGEEAGYCFQDMQHDGIAPDYATFACCLKASGARRAIEAAQELHTEVAKRGLETELHVGSTLVDVYIVCGLLLEAIQVFKWLPARNEITWNALISGYAEHGLVHELQNCLQQMQIEGNCANPITYACTLRACADAVVLDRGIATHMEVVKRGLEREPYIGGILVEMYVQCGSLTDAQQVFDWLTSRDIVSWNALIAGQVQYGLAEDVENFLGKMYLESISPDPFTFSYILKACCKTLSLDTGQKIHDDLTKRAWEKDVHIGSALIDMYCECGCAEEAHHVFDKAHSQIMILWNAWMSGYSKRGCDEKVRDLYGQMVQKGILPDSTALALVLKACGTQSVEKGQELHAEAIKRGLEREPNVGSMLVRLYNRFDMLTDAHDVFAAVEVQNAACWNALIDGYVEHSLNEKAEMCFREMLSEGTPPDSNTFLCILKAVNSTKAVKAGHEMHAEAIKRGLEGEHHVGNLLVQMYGKCGMLDEGQKVFDGMTVPSTASWTALISGYDEYGLGDEAMDLFQQHMKEDNSCPDSVAFLFSLKACAVGRALESGQGIHGHITESGLEGDLHLGSATVDLYGECGLLVDARNVFDCLPVQSAVAWTAMIKAYGKSHEGDMALQCFEDMLNNGVLPNSVTFVCLLSVCSHSSLVAKGMEFFKMMRELDIRPTLDHYVCVVDLLARSGHVCEAERLLESMQCCPAGIILYVLLSACKVYGELEIGERCFQQLIQASQDDASAYLLMADVYAGAGRWNDANKLMDVRAGGCVRKKPGNASIEVKQRMHVFIVGAEQTDDLLEKLAALSLVMKVEGFIPDVDWAARSFSDGGEPLS